MIAATRPFPRAHERLLHLDPHAGRFRDTTLTELPALLRSGDLLIVNDAATLPASLSAIAPGGARVELRLLGEMEDRRWRAVLFGEGDWHLRTEERPAPPILRTGDVLQLDGVRATVVSVWYPSPRLVELRFDAEGAALWSALYRLGRPIQYAHLEAGLALSDVQTVYASRPWAAELPSAGRPLSWEVLLDLKARGIALGALTHAAGLSSTGDPALDRALPLPERYEIPVETVDAVGRARAAGGRVVAVGTSVVRALEGSGARHGGTLVAGRGTTDLVIAPGFVPRVVDGLLTGFHEPGSSHLGLLRAFVPPPLLDAAYTHAEAEGYRGHEFGDSNLILAA
ncbi:MAG: S-adenosylmethionine tRNA ribosyltransferase [Acidobacteria bacterium]|nr:MAG: S-adenosylmethionine tRNA ribosyltransferase [Acidobacteriota bacterium]